MSRRHRKEFHKLESQLEYGVQDRAWRALIDKTLYNQGNGPEPIRNQLRLRDRLRRLHARRDRYNQKRYNERYAAFLRKLEPRHIIAGIAIGTRVVDSAMPLRDLIKGAIAGDRRLSRRFLEELETVYETIHPSLPAHEMHSLWIEWQRKGKPPVQVERQEFEEHLKPTPLPEQPPAPISHGFDLPETNQTDVPSRQSHSHAA
ncbi:MAG: hypothetical protein ABJQ29_15670 [Luteolibacter sp.]